MIVAEEQQDHKKRDVSVTVDSLPENVTKNDTLELLETRRILAFEIPSKYDVHLLEDWDKIMGHLRVGYKEEDMESTMTNEISLREEELMTQAQTRHKIVSDTLLAATICALAAVGVVIMAIFLMQYERQHDSARESPTSLSILTEATQECELNNKDEVSNED
jgi:hypothetical protein